MFHDLPEAAGLEVRIGDQVVQAVDHHHRHVGISQPLQPLSAVTFANDFARHPVRLIDIFQSLGHVDKARVRGQLRAAGDVAECAPVGIPVGQYRQVKAVPAAVWLAVLRHQAGISGSPNGRLESLPPEVFDHQP